MALREKWQRHAEDLEVKVDQHQKQAIDYQGKVGIVNSIITYLYYCNYYITMFWVVRFM